MDLNQLFDVQDLSGTFSILDVTIALALSFALSALVGWVYKRTHRNVSYSQSYVQTLVLVSLVLTVIMLVVGSNIARAFALVGALSVIRFRNAVKETRDVGFLFLAMAIGMTTGTRFYVLAVGATIVTCVAILVMFRFDWYRADISRQILKVQVPNDGIDHTAEIESALAGIATGFELVSAEGLHGGALTELTYSTQVRKGVKTGEVMRVLQDAAPGMKTTVLTGHDQTDL